MEVSEIEDKLKVVRSKPTKNFFDFWKKLPLGQKISLSALVLFLTVLPLGVIVVLSPTRLNPRAQNLATPPETPPDPTIIPVPSQEPGVSPTLVPSIVPVPSPSPIPIVTPSPSPSRYIMIVNPNGGETLYVGQSYRISWNSSSNIDKVSVMLKDSFGTGSWIVTNIPNLGYYDWTVSTWNTTNTQFKIWIIGYQTGVGSATDESNNLFTILKTAPSPTPTPSPSPTPNPEVSFQFSSSSGTENKTTAYISVKLSKASNKTVTVLYRSVGGTATSGRDYLLNPGKVTFRSGQTTRLITLKVTNDTLKETNETVLIDLYNPVYATLGTLKRFQYTIIDND